MTSFINLKDLSAVFFFLSGMENLQYFSFLNSTAIVILGKKDTYDKLMDTNLDTALQRIFYHKRKMKILRSIYGLMITWRLSVLIELRKIRN